jgi:hypothetical protein
MLTLPGWLQFAGAPEAVHCAFAGLAVNATSPMNTPIVRKLLIADARL